MAIIDLEAEIDRYCGILAPLFEWGGHPFDYVLALLRANGEEGEGWDTLEESLRTLDDLQTLSCADLPAESFPTPEHTKLRLELLTYCHLVEMDAPYDIIANMLRVKSRMLPSLAPFASKLTQGDCPLNEPSCSKSQATIRRSKLPYPTQKIDKINSLAKKVGSPAIGEAFRDFYRNGIRNAAVHSDYIIHGDVFRMRNQTVPNDDGTGETSAVKLGKLREWMTRARAFYLAFFRVEKGARLNFARMRGVPHYFDHHNKGILEFLVDGEGYLRGAVIHYPNGSECRYERTAAGSKPLNIWPGDDGFLIGPSERHKPHDPFSPVLKPGQLPTYTSLEGSDQPLNWLV